MMTLRTVLLFIIFRRDLLLIVFVIINEIRLISVLRRPFFIFYIVPTESLSFRFILFRLLDIAIVFAFLLI